MTNASAAEGISVRDQASQSIASLKVLEGKRKAKVCKTRFRAPMLPNGSPAFAPSGRDG
jgi:hypothetical protein